METFINYSNLEINKILDIIYKFANNKNNIELKFIYIFFLFSIFGFSQEYNISGYVIDRKTGETLIGANIYNTSSQIGASSNSYGYFSMNLLQGETMLICSFV